MWGWKGLYGRTRGESRVPSRLEQGEQDAGDHEGRPYGLKKGPFPECYKKPITEGTTPLTR